MPRLVMMRGLPASGKSTYAKKLVDNEGFKRVSRDDLRVMLDNGKYSPENEIAIKVVEHNIVVCLVSQGYSVVVDDTNLSSSDKLHWEGTSRTRSAEFEIVEMDTSVNECINRDSKRASPVGAKRILEMADQYGYQ